MATSDDKVVRTSPNIDIEEFHDVMKSNMIFQKSDITWYSKFSRFKYNDIYNMLIQSREYVFFVKPDLHIFTPNTNTLQPVLASDTFFMDLAERYPHVIQTLQKSAGPTGDIITRSPFMTMLSNAIDNTIDLEDITATTMDGPSNAYGTSMTYRKDGWHSDEDIDISVEFRDTKWLEVYMLLKAYEEYERYNTLGYIYPPNLNGAREVGDMKHNFNSYMQNKERHDTFGIYRFVVDEDYTHLIYWAYVCGAFFTNVPRGGLNDIKDGDGLKYTVSMKAFSVDDMNPQILANFNTLVSNAYGTPDASKEIPIWGTKPVSSDSTTADKEFKQELSSNATVNTEWATFPYVVKKLQTTDVLGRTLNGIDQMKYTYELRWYNS
jgi:hypothetical protein